MYIGIDLGGTNIAVGLVAYDGTILDKTSVPTQSGRNADEIVKDMADAAAAVICANGKTKDDVRAVGIGCPGTIEFDTGTVVYSNNIKMDRYPLADKFREHLDLPVKVDNDANCAAMGEYTVSGDGVQSFLLITLGTGVGGGLIINGKMYRGFNGAAIEAGHTSFVFDGERCSCGKKGCWEAYASVTALIRDTKRAIEANPDSLMKTIAQREGKVSGRTSFTAARQGDEAAKAVVKRYAEYIAEGITSCENFLQPEIIAIGGGISREGDYLLNPIREYVEANRYNRYMPKTKIVTAKLHNDAGIIGAAMVAKGDVV